MNFIVLSEPCVVLRSDSPKPWHPPESGVRLIVNAVFPLKTWEAVSWGLEIVVGSAFAVCGVETPSLYAIFSAVLFSTVLDPES